MAPRVLAEACLGRVARRLACALVLWAGVWGCGEEPELVVETPLFVFNTYPANGATVAREDLGELAVTFSKDVGEASRVRELAREQLLLVGPNGSVGIVRPDYTNVAYDPDAFTLRVELDPESRDLISPGVWEFTILREFATEDGIALPTDFVVRFHVAEE